MTPYDFLLDTYETERLKTLTVWSQFADAELPYRPAPLARTPHEHMVHQCVSENSWMCDMLGHSLYSTYGLTADTGGLFQNHAPVIYRYSTVDELLAAEAEGGRFPSLPGPGAASPTERPSSA